MKTKKSLTGAQAYCPPESKIMEFAFEGVLCYSPTGSSADDLTVGDPLTDYEQIF